MLGAVASVGVSCEYGAISSDAGLAPFMRSPSVQWAMPGTEAQLVHCQNVQPRPFQFCGGDPRLARARPVRDPERRAGRGDAGRIGEVLLPERG